MLVNKRNSKKLILSSLKWKKKQISFLFLKRIIIVIITQTNGRKFLELIPVNLTALDMAAILDDLQAGAHAQKVLLWNPVYPQQNGGMLWTTWLRQFPSFITILGYADGWIWSNNMVGI